MLKTINNHIGINNKTSFAYSYALKLNADERWNYVFKLASSVNRCGEDSHDGCGCLQPKKFKKEGLATLFAEWDNVNGLDLEEDKEKLTTRKRKR